MYAHLWGYCRQGRETEYVHVDRIGVCVSAKAKKDQVKLSKDVITLQDDIVKRWSPHVSLLEDFHTHPWESRKELRRFRGWNFSDTDKDSFLADDELWKHAGDNPITLVMAVTKLQRVRKSQTKQLRQQHRGQFNIGQVPVLDLGESRAIEP